MSRWLNSSRCKTERSPSAMRGKNRLFIFFSRTVHLVPFFFYFDFNVVCVGREKKSKPTTTTHFVGQTRRRPAGLLFCSLPRHSYLLPLSTQSLWWRWYCKRVHGLVGCRAIELASPHASAMVDSLARKVTGKGSRKVPVAISNLKVVSEKKNKVKKKRMRTASRHCTVYDNGLR